MADNDVCSLDSMQFITELNDLLNKHNIRLLGTQRIICLKADDWDVLTASTTVCDTVDVYGGTDRAGPFLVSTIEKKQLQYSMRPNAAGFYISSDYQGYDCPVTGKWIDGRAAHRENLKRTGCRILEKGEKESASKVRERELDSACRETARELTRKIARNYMD